MGGTGSASGRRTDAALAGIAILLLVAAATIGAEAVGGEKGGRVVHFPEDRSLGKVYLVEGSLLDPAGDPWRAIHSTDNILVGEARGDVDVPAGKLLKLEISVGAWRVSQPYRELAPDAIDILGFLRFAEADDRAMRGVERLTGLKALEISRCEKISAKGLKYVARIKRLEFLFLCGDIDTEALEPLGGLGSLRYLHMGGPEVDDEKIAPLGRIGSLEAVSLPASYVGRGLEHLKSIESLKYIDLKQDQNPGVGEGLANLKNIEKLILKGSAITNAGLSCIRNMKNLKVLDLGYTQIGDEGLAHIAGLKNLQTLNLFKNPDLGEITDAGMVHIAKVTSLEDLSIACHKVTDAGAANLGALPALRRLVILNHAVITDESMAILGNIESLREVTVFNKNITDKGLADLCRNTNIEVLKFNQWQVTDEGMASLAELKSLRELQIIDSPVTGKGVAVLKELPSLKKLEFLNLSLGEDGLANLAGLGTVETLWLAHAKMNIGNQELDHIGTMTNLRTLDITPERKCITQTFNNEGFSHLGKLKSLEHLDIAMCSELTDNGMKALADSYNLRFLWLRNCTQITDGALRHFEGLSQLRFLGLDNSRVSEAGLTALEQKIPNLYCRRAPKQPPPRPR